jgi:hypothetical protein
VLRRGSAVRHQEPATPKTTPATTPATIQTITVVPTTGSPWASWLT